MFWKFFEACAITLGLYLCLQSSNFSTIDESYLLFRVTKSEQFFLFNLQEDMTYNRWQTWTNKSKFQPRVRGY